MHIVRSAMLGMLAACFCGLAPGTAGAARLTGRTNTGPTAAQLTSTTQPRPTPGSTSGNPSSGSPHHGHAVYGIVEHVNRERHEIRIRVYSQNGKGHHHEMVFHVNGSTRFEKVHGKQHHLAHFRDVHHGEHVVIHHAPHHDHLATEVVIHVHGHSQGTTTTARTNLAVPK